MYIYSDSFCVAIIILDYHKQSEIVGREPKTNQPVPTVIRRVESLPSGAAAIYRSIQSILKLAE
jgi:hypothetical protein